MSTPALDWIIAEEWQFHGPEGECFACPFASATPGEDVNPSDPGEGFYDCALIGRSRVWGESPECTSADWKREARAEPARRDPR